VFHDWENFYLIVGSAAAALIGVMFVVVTLAAGFSSASRLAQGARVYLTPVVFHLSLVVVVSALAVTPEIQADVIGALVAVGALSGFIYTILTTVRMFGGGLPTPPDLSDRWFYGVLPSLSYAALAGAAIACWTTPRAAAYGIGGTMLILVLISIRNAWDLATFMTTTERPREDK
jgi:uncharacterized protein YbjT (DUF2867 family)